MGKVKSKNTTPELTVRRLLHALGYRYRLHAKDIPGRPDIIFRTRKKVIFVHGCFWHRHSCPNGQRTPKTHINFWENKFEKNKERDQRTLALLKQLGWECLVVWECEVKNTLDICSKLKSFIGV